MSLWIITTGNSDLRLKHDKNWMKFFTQVRNDLECKQFSNPSRNIDNVYVTPARLLGHVYKQQSDDYESDLCFPLLDTFCKLVEAKKIRLDRVVMLLSDQQHIFKEQQRCYNLSPYWQDTCTLQPIFEWYFQQKLKLKPEFLLIQPQSGQGLDHWNETLSLINNVLQSIESNPLKNVYVSHQAGTPAISSAVQFVVLNKFKKVSFILSNQYYDSTDAQESQAEEVEYILQANPEEVNSNTSEYRRSFQILKAKQLITDGFPGAALKILEEIERIHPEAKDELEQMVHFFNLHSVNRDSNKDFEIDNASQRIVDSLDLIKFFFNQNNYLQGITLLAAAQETFLKVAIFHEIQKITDKYRDVPVSKLVQWDNEGLSLIKNENLRRQFNVSNQTDLNLVKEEVIRKLKFPVQERNFKRYDHNGDVIFKTNANNAMLAWLSKLNSDFKPWENLKWSCSYYKDRESDLRNQLMHNLRGMEDSDVVQYLLGYPTEEPVTTNVKETYERHVKQPFTRAISHLNLPCKRDKLQVRLQNLADSLV